MEEEKYLKIKKVKKERIAFHLSSTASWKGPEAQHALFPKAFKRSGRATREMMLEDKAGRLVRPKSMEERGLEE